MGWTIELEQLWNDVRTDRIISQALACVPQSTSFETIDISKAYVDIATGVEKLAQEEDDVESSDSESSDSDTNLDTKTYIRKEVIGLLNSVYYSHLQSPILPNWWYENSLRLRKLIILSTVLESINFIQMGGRPEQSDIPQSLPALYRIADDSRTSKPYLQQQHDENCALYPNLVLLYTQAPISK